MVKFVFQSEMTLTFRGLSLALLFVPQLHGELLVQEGGDEHDGGQPHQGSHAVQLPEAGNVITDDFQQGDAQQGESRHAHPGRPDVKPRGDQAQDAPALKIATLHPILGDMARAIGGSHVQVADLLRPNGNLHSFEPAPQDIAAAGQARLVLASGKNLEPYLPKLKDALGGRAQILDLGASIPDVPVAADTADHDHGHDGDCCAHGPNDPHWWHTPANMKRAARALAAALTRMDPAHEQDYKAGLARWNRKMDQLSSWARKELADIPEADRILVTGHAAMNHFCKEFGFRSISIQGVSREDEGNSAQLASTLKKLRAAGVKALFPEYSSNPKSLTEIAKSLNIPVAKPINTDGLAPDGHTFESMFKQNVGIIKEALSPSPRP